MCELRPVQGLLGIPVNLSLHQTNPAYVLTDTVTLGYCVTILNNLPTSSVSHVGSIGSVSSACVWN